MQRVPVQVVNGSFVRRASVGVSLVRRLRDEVHFTRVLPWFSSTEDDQFASITSNGEATRLTDSARFEWVDLNARLVQITDNESADDESDPPPLEDHE